jgi:hypothetical protein
MTPYGCQAKGSPEDKQNTQCPQIGPWDTQEEGRMDAPEDAPPPRFISRAVRINLENMFHSRQGSGQVPSGLHEPAHQSVSGRVLSIGAECHPADLFCLLRLSSISGSHSRLDKPFALLLGLRRDERLRGPQARTTFRTKSAAR